MYEHMAVYGPIFTADNVTDGLVNMNDVLQLKYGLSSIELYSLIMRITISIIEYRQYLEIESFFLIQLINMSVRRGQ